MSNFIGIMIDKIMPEQVPDLVHFLQTKIRWIYFCQLFMEKKNEKTMLSASNIKATQKKKKQQTTSKRAGFILLIYEK